MIVLEKLTWSDMFSYGSNNSIRFDDEPLVQIVGVNGSGKSSIPLILEEFLFNKNSKGVKKGDIPNRELGTGKYSGSVEFSIGADKYLLKISRSGATQKVSLLKNGSDISSHTATDTFKQIEQLFGIDQKEFSQWVYQSSASSLQFLTATDTNRKKFLIDLLNLDKYVKAFDTIKVLHKNIQDAFNKVNAKRDTVNTFIDKYKKADLNLKEYVDVPTSVDMGKVSKLSELRTTLADIDKKNKTISNNNLYKKSLDALDVSLAVSAGADIDTSIYVAEQASITTSIAATRKHITKLKGLDKVCTTCEQPIPLDQVEKQLASLEALVASMEAELATVKEELIKANNLNKSNSEKRKVLSDFEKYSALVDDSLPTVEYNAAEIKSEIRAIENFIDACNLEIEKAETKNREVAAFNAKVQSIVEQLSEFSTELQSLESAIADLEKQLSNYEILKKVFSTNGLIAYKLESSVKELESLANDYLSELSDGRFQLSFEINNDKLNVVIIDNGTSIDISALSMGELSRVNTAALLAIRKLMNSISKSRINLLFLDETIDNLDINGKEKLIEVLLNEEGLNTFLISHGYSHPLLSKIQVVKEEGISRIENA